MPPITPGDLSPELQAILGTESWDGACTSDQPVCESDPRVTSQLTEEPAIPSEKVLPWRIANAHAGDVIMSPGGPSGLIGGLLAHLDPPQRFSHNAVMTVDEIELRHATASPDRLGLFNDGSILGIVDAPTNGFKEHALRYQWPGTITQSVEIAYLTVRDKPLKRDAGGELEEDDNNAPIPIDGFGYRDDETGSSFLIDAMSFNPVPMNLSGSPTVVWPLVVTSCPGLTTTGVIAARRRVARAAKEIRGHYRLFAYTDGSISETGPKDGPPSLEATRPDPVCTGSGGTQPTVSTQAMVCSTFIWAAVQRANAQGRLASPPSPQIILDGRQRERVPLILPSCEDTAWQRRLPHIDQIDGQTPDGLYFYGEGERLRAATWLHDDYMVPYVRAEVDKALPNVWADLGVAEGLGITALISLLSAVPVNTVATILGIGPEVIEELVILTTDMPDDVANQLCNSFAFDDSSQSATDSNAWNAPGVGRTVSPDNIVNSWAAPTSEDEDTIHGLYGWNDRVRMRPPSLRRNPPPKSTWQISQGIGTLSGRVVARDAGGQISGVPGALVRIGCRHLAAGVEGYIREEPVPSGRYWCVAKFTDTTTGLVMESSGQEIEISPGESTPYIEIELIPPSDVNREVLVSGHMDLVNRYAIGEDWWGHPSFIEGPRYLGLEYWPDDPEFAVRRAESLRQTVVISRRVDDWGSAILECKMEIRADKSVDIAWQAALKSSDNDPWQKSGSVNISPRILFTDPQPNPPVVIDLVRSEMAWPVRAHIEFNVVNDRAP